MTQLNMNLVNDFTKTIESQLVTWRRTLHSIPEVGWCEYQTTAFIFEQLQSTDLILRIGDEVCLESARMGLPDEVTNSYYYELAKSDGVSDQLLEKIKGNKTGLIAQLDTGKPGKYMAFRFDIDALPIVESNAPQHKPTQCQFNSKHEATMHSCGHDGHTAIGLGVAFFLNKYKDQLSGKYTLIFQPAEEGVRGGKSIVEKGWLDEVDLFVSGHIMQGEIGTIYPGISSTFATSKLNVEFKGISSHAGANPESGKNALLASAAATLHLHGISRHADGTTRINVGKLIAGSGRNIIADHARLEVETRGDTTELNQYMVNEATRMIRASAQLYDVAYEIDLVGEGISAASDEEWKTKVNEATLKSDFVQKVFNEFIPLSGSEDATYMMKRVQEQGGLATYLLFGGELAKHHHHPLFDYDEKVLSVAVNTFISIVVNEQK